MVEDSSLLFWTNYHRTFVDAVIGKLGFRGCIFPWCRHENSFTWVSPIISLNGLFPVVRWEVAIS